MNMKETIAQSSALTVSITNADANAMSNDHVGSKQAGEASVCGSKRPRMASIGTESSVSRRLQFATATPSLEHCSPAVAVRYYQANIYLVLLLYVSYNWIQEAKIRCFNSFP